MIEEIKSALPEIPAEEGSAGVYLNGEERAITPRSAADFDTEEIEAIRMSDSEKLRRKIIAQKLPVMESLDLLVDKIVDSSHRKGILLFQGETGSGKSIYSPIACREALYRLGLADHVIMMQPRRDACSNVARLTAALQKETLGEGVGFSTSEFEEVNPDTAVKVVTPGIFLKYLINGSINKEEVGAVIIDEAHEGTMEYHLALGLLKKMQEQGNAPQIIVTSATMNKELIQGFFGIGEDDYIRIEGRAHPVDKFFMRPVSDIEKFDYLKATAEKAKNVAIGSEAGDILVFLPGSREIDTVIDHIGKINGVEVLPLHGSLHPDARNYALSDAYPEGIRKRIIVATNIAETSLTLPNVRTVVDSCRQRLVRYNPVTGIDERGTEFISKDQAEQRAGRAGRVAPGKCHRIATESEFNAFDKHPVPEILRGNLASIVLRLKGLNIDPLEFDFIVPPEKKSVQEAEKELQMLGALDENKKITEIGRKMMEMPFEPPLARMIIEAKKRNCLEVALVLAVFLREQDVFLGPKPSDVDAAFGEDTAEKRKNARISIFEKYHRQFERGNSDIFQNLNVLKEAIAHGLMEVSAGQRNRSRKTQEQYIAEEEFYGWCKQNYLKDRVLLQVVNTLKRYAQYAGVKIDYADLPKLLETVDENELTCSLLAAHASKVMHYVPGIGMPVFHNIFAGTFTTPADINPFPGSRAFGAPPPVCFATKIEEGRGTIKVKLGYGHYEKKEITRNYAKQIHPVNISQLKTVLPHALSITIGQPEYSESDDAVSQSISYSLKNGVFLAIEKEKVTGSLAVKGFAGYLASGRNYREFTNHNIVVAKQLDEFYTRSGGEIFTERFDLVQWYEKRLETVCSIAGALEMVDKLTLNLHDFISEQQIAKIDRIWPNKISLAGIECQVRYSLVEFSHKAFIKVSKEVLSNIKTADMPQIGRSNKPVAIEFTAILPGDYYSKVFNTLAELQAAYKLAINRNRWIVYSDEHPQKSFVVNEDQPLPSLADLATRGFKPVVYATDESGEKLLAYPGLTCTASWEGELSCFLKYYQSETEALEMRDRAEAVRAQLYERNAGKRKFIERKNRFVSDSVGYLNKIEELFHIGKMSGDEAVFLRERVDNARRYYNFGEAYLDQAELMEEQVVKQLQRFSERRMPESVFKPIDLQPEAAPVDQGEKFGSLADRLKNKEQPKEEPRTPTPVKIVQPQEVIKETMTPELRAKLTEKLNLPKLFLEDAAKTKAPKPEDPKLVKAIKSAQDKLKRLKEIAAELERLDNVERARGLINEITGPADKLPGEVARLLRLNENWPAVYRELVEVFIPEIATDYGVELSSDLWEKMKPRLIILAKERNQDGLRAKAEEILSQLA